MEDCVFGGFNVVDWVMNSRCIEISEHFILLLNETLNV